MSSHIAYHMEAQRKQRTLDRKYAALKKMERERTEIERFKDEQIQKQQKHSLEQEEVNSQAREYYLKNMGNQNGHSQRYIDMIPERQHVVNRNDMRHQARVLRDNCLYMGPVNEYFWA